MPPLLNGIGRPSLTLIYHAVAAITLPAVFALSGTILGPSLGYVSVAVGWAIGYPVAFTVLVSLALRQLGLAPATYLRRTLGIPGCAVLAAPGAWAAHHFTSGWAALPRLVAVSVAALAVFLTALAYLQGISPRTMWRSFGSPPAA